MCSRTIAQEAKGTQKRKFHYSQKNQAAHRQGQSTGPKRKVSESRVKRTIGKKLKRKRIKQKAIKHLTDAMIAKRRDRAKGFAEPVAGEKACLLYTSPSPRD